jgi:hypothetical protein
MSPSAREVPATVTSKFRARDEDTTGVCLMKILEDDERYLLTAMSRGEAMLVLGAGATSTSTNARGERVKLARDLAAEIAGRAALPYAGEKLTDVLDAVRGKYLSDVQIRAILTEEYRGISPSPDLELLFRVCWRRVYTWNIDDAIENLRKARIVQRHRTYNGMVDRVAEYEGFVYLHIVYLHGQIIKPDHGFILTDAEYSNAIRDSGHHWYKRLAQDYLACCPIFLGTELSEPILSSELERAKRDEKSVAGRAFLITPGELAPIAAAKISAKGIVHVSATLAEFSKWLGRHFPTGLDPKAVVARTSRYSDERTLGSLSPGEVEVARHLRPMLN